MSMGMVQVQFQQNPFPLTWKYFCCRCLIKTNFGLFSSPWQGRLNDSLIIANDCHIYVKVVCKVGGRMPLSKHFEHVSKTCSKHIQCVFKSKNTFNEFSKHIQFVFKSKNTFNAFSKHIECVC